MEHFTAHRLRFVTEVASPIELNAHKGSAIRGALYHALTDGFCMHKPALAANGCAQCPLVATCPVAFLVATLDPRSDRGANVPRPYTIEPPLDNEPMAQSANEPNPNGHAKTTYAKGERFEFGLTMFARALNLFPYVVLSIKNLEKSGIGKRVAENRYQRGRFVVREIWAENPLTGERQPVLREGEAMVQVPDVPITSAAVSRQSSAVSAEGITLRFLTPTRLVDDGHLVRHPDFRVLVQRLFERLSALARTFGDAPLALDFAGLIADAARVQCVRGETRWVELESYSTRLGRATPIGGFVGAATYSGNLAPFLPWLLWGQFTHVGKDAVKGNGWYEVSG